jgi:hypothetical protein
VRKRDWYLLMVPVLLATGCLRDSGDNLRDSYERMVASAERRPQGDSPRAEILEVSPATPAADSPRVPAALPIDEPRPAAPAPAEPVAPEPVAPEPVAPEPVAPEALVAADAEPPAFEGTAGVQQRQRPGPETVALRATRIGPQTGFDRVVFEFEGTVPGYRIEYVDQPIRECGTGRAVQVAGQGWLRVRIDPAQATVGDFNRTVDHTVLQQLVKTCNSAGQVEWVLGLRAPNRYRTLVLGEPARLVVDVLH